MEDYPRDLEKELTRYSVPNPFKKSRRWQLLFISDDGKMISVKRYKELVITLFAALSIAILSAACFSVLYYRAMKVTNTIRVSHDDAKKELEALKAEKELLLAKIHLPIKRKEDVVAVEKKSETVSKKTSKPPEKKAKKKKKTPEMKVAVKDLTIRAEEGKSLMKIRFIVRNTSKLKSIEGRVFVVLKPDSKRQQDWVAIPATALKKGVPSLPSRGQFFSINHFKSVKFKFNNRVSPDYYKKITIFVFSMDGKKVFEETLPIKVDIKKKPVAKQNRKPKPEKKIKADNPASSEKKSENSPVETGSEGIKAPANNTVSDVPQKKEADSSGKPIVKQTEKPKVEGTHENEN